MIDKIIMGTHLIERVYIMMIIKEDQCLTYHPLYHAVFSCVRKG